MLLGGITETETETWDIDLKCISFRPNKSSVFSVSFLRTSSESEIKDTLRQFVAHSRGERDQYNLPLWFTLDKNSSCRELTTFLAKLEENSEAINTAQFGNLIN